MIAKPLPKEATDTLCKKLVFKAMQRTSSRNLTSFSRRTIRFITYLSVIRGNGSRDYCWRIFSSNTDQQANKEATNDMARSVYRLLRLWEWCWAWGYRESQVSVTALWRTVFDFLRCSSLQHFMWLLKAVLMCLLDKAYTMGFSTQDKYTSHIAILYTHSGVSEEGWQLCTIT